MCFFAGTEPIPRPPGVDEGTGFMQAFDLIAEMCDTPEKQEAFDILIDNRNAYVCAYVRLTLENHELRTRRAP